MLNNELVKHNLNELLENLKTHTDSDRIYGETIGFIRCAYLSDSITEDEFDYYYDLALEIRYH